MGTCGQLRSDDVWRAPRALLVQQVAATRRHHSHGGAENPQEQKMQDLKLPDLLEMLSV